MGGRSTLGQAGRGGSIAATIVVWRCMSNVWKQYRLPCVAESEDAMRKIEEEGEVEEGAKKRRSRIEEGDLKLVGRWIMSSNISTVAKSDVVGIDKLCFGLEDGAVVMWDNKTNTPVAGCSRHQAPVSSCCFVGGARYLVSGDLNGAVHFHDLDTEATGNAHRARERMASASHSSLGSRMVSGSRKGTASKAQLPPTKIDITSMVLKDPRNGVELIKRRGEDFENPVINCIALKSGVGGCAVVVCSDETGTIVTYDAALGDLVGKLSPYVISGHAHDIPEEGYTKPLSVKAGRRLCMRQAVEEAEEGGLGEDGLGPSASVESLGAVHFDLLDSVRSALSKKPIVGCGSDCITIVAGGTDIFNWQGEDPSVPEAGAEADESASSSMGDKVRPSEERGQQAA